MSNKLKFAVVGCGAVGKGALNLAVKSDDIDCVGAFEPNHENARAIAEEYKIPVFDKLEELLETQRPDCVKICSPNQFHAKQSILCLEHNCNVLTEKPMATNLEDCQRMIDAQKKSGKILSVNFEFRISKLFAKVNEIIESGRIGEVRNIFIYESRGPFMGEKNSWRFKKDGVGGLITEKLVHFIDLSKFFAKSDIKLVFAHYGPNTIRHYGFPDNAFLILKHQNGAQSVIGTHHGVQPEWDFGNYLNMGNPALREKRYKWWNKTGGKEFVMVTGTKGAIHADTGQEIVTSAIYVSCDSRGGQATRPDAEYDFSYLDRMEQVHDQEGLLRHFLEAVKGKEPIKIPAEDVFNSMAATFAAEKALDNEGISVTVL